MNSSIPDDAENAAAPLFSLMRSPETRRAERQPAVILLHGRGSDEQDLFGFANALDQRLLIISARAPFPLGSGYHWYELIDIGTPEPESYARARALLAQFVEQVSLDYGIAPADLYLLGFSQGAMMAGTLALTRPDLMAGVVLLSGYLPLHAGLALDATSLKERPFFVAHGTLDPVIPIRYARETRDYLTAAGADLTYREYEMAHQISYETLHDLGGWLSARLDADGDENLTASAG